MLADANKLPSTQQPAGSSCMGKSPAAMDPIDTPFEKTRVPVERRPPQPGCKEREQVISGADIEKRIIPNLESYRRQLMKLLQDLASSSGGGAVHLEGFAVSLIATFVEDPTKSAKDAVDYQPLVLTCGDDYHVDNPQEQPKRVLNLKDVLSATNWKISNDTKRQKVSVNEGMDSKGGKEKNHRNMASSSSSGVTK